MAKCKSCGSPLCSGCSAAHMKEGSPAKMFGMANNAMAQAAQQQSTGISGGDLESRITALEQNAPSNTLGNAKPVFNSQAQQAAQGIYGSVDQRQGACGNPFMYKDGSPLEGNAFIAAKIAAEKAGKSSFEVGGKTFPVK